MNQRVLAVNVAGDSDAIRQLQYDEFMRDVRRRDQSNEEHPKYNLPKQKNVEVVVESDEEEENPFDPNPLQDPAAYDKKMQAKMRNFHTQLLPMSPYPDGYTGLPKDVQSPPKSPGEHAYKKNRMMRENYKPPDPNTPKRNSTDF